MIHNPIPGRTYYLRIIETPEDMHIKIRLMPCKFLRLLPHGKAEVMMPDDYEDDKVKQVSVDRLYTVETRFIQWSECI